MRSRKRHRLLSRRSLTPSKPALVKSLNRPGGNATGTAGLTSELDPKRLEFLREAKPTAAMIGVLVNPNRPGLESQLGELQAAANKFNVKLEVQKAASDQQLQSAFQAFASQRVDALVVTADPIFNNRRAQVLSLSAKPVASGHLPMARVRNRRWTNELRPQHHGSLSQSRDQRGPNSKGHQTSRYSGCAAHKISVGYQPEDCKTAWPRALPIFALCCRRAY